MRKALLGILALGCISLNTTAQDVHFTQYFTSPLTLNPAQTGLTQNDWRASANFRSQWYTMGNPYVSGTVAFDMPILKGKLPEGDAMGIGLLGMYDKAGSGALQNTTLGLSVAYHKAFGYDKQHTLSLGVQGYFVQKSLQFDKLIFGDEFNASSPLGYIPNSTKEQSAGGDLTYPDFNAGLMYSGQVSEKATMYGGLAFYHLTRPEERFIGTGTPLKINNRISAHIGGSIEMNENTVLYLSAMYQKQGPASELLLGGAVGFIMNPGHDEYTRNTVFYLGAWYRHGDAFAPYIGFEWSKMKIGISYDVTMSGFSPAVQGQGAYEFSVIYNGVISKVTKRKYNFACPKF